MRLPYTSEINEDQNAGICNKCNWPRFRIKHLLREIDLRTENGMEPLFSMRQTKGLILHSEVSDKPIKYEDLVGYKIVLPGLIVMNRMRASIGLFAASYSHGLVSPDYAVFQPQKPVNLDYLVRFFQTPLMKTIFRKESKGMGTGSSGFLRLYTDRFGAIPISLPPLAEQNHIVDVVKSLDRKISRFLRNKRRLIGLLKEQKQNIINRAVTRGLDPNVKLKSSGVEWIGDIPEHWNISKIKRLVSFNPSKSETDVNLAEERMVVFLPMEKISANGQIDCSEKRSLTEVWSGFTYFRRGDVVIAKITPCFENGKGAHLEELETDFGFGTTELIVLRPSSKIEGAFLRLHTSSKRFLELGEQHMTGAAGQQRISSEFVSDYRIGLPPVNEQKEILRYIDKNSRKIDRAISRSEREIELMTEYRTRLISDVVTGKVDVRDIDVPEISEDELLAPEEEPEAEEGLSEEEVPGDENGEADE